MEVQIRIHVYQGRPFLIIFKGGVTQRYPNLELPFVFAEREVCRVTLKYHRGIFRFPGNQCLCQVFAQEFPHQRYREIAPGFPGIRQGHAAEDPERRRPVLIMLIAEVAVRPQRAGLQI